MRRESEELAEGGSIERTLAGDFDFDIAEILREAWRLTSGSKGPILGGLTLAYLINFGVSFFSQQMAGSTDQPNFDQVGILLVGSLFAAAIVSPITAGVIIFAIKRAAGDPSAGSGDVLACYDRIIPLAILMLVQGALTVVGFMLFVLPGIYLSIAYSLAIPLVAVRRMGIWEALETSRRIITRCWWQVFGLYVVMAVGGLAFCLVTFLIGAIWFAPMAVLCLGVIYRDLVGYRGVSS